MKFAFILFKYIPFGGMQRNMLAIARACADRGHDITIICSQWQGEPLANMRVIQLPVSGWRRFGGNGTQMQQFHRAFRAQLHKEPQDLVVGFNKFPDLDVYYAADSCFASKAYEQKSWLYRLTPRAQVYLAFEKAVFSASGNTRILEVSPRERTQFIKHYGTPAERFFPLPPGIARDRAALEHGAELRRQTRRKLNIDDDTTVFLAVGSGFKTKGLDRSIQLVADWQAEQQSPAVLLVAGADKKAIFRQQARRLGVQDRVTFLGGRDDVPALFKAADLVLHPAYRENTGNVLLEAMIAGRPVLATDVCGYAHYVSDAQMGEVLASPFSATAFYRAAMRILAVANQEWRRRGAEFAKREDIYSRPAVAADLLEQFCRYDGKATSSVKQAV
ncbi:MAG: glycosyltransferase family 4 protein [Cellvibrionaceae bacterium]